MFEVLVYLYETYYRPDACPEPEVLARKLNAIGFEDEEISQALGWLTDLRAATEAMLSGDSETLMASSGTRIYVAEEMDVMGAEAVGFVQFLEAAGMLNAVQREVVVDCAMACGEEPVSLEKIKVIILMVLWSEGTEPDSLMFDELFVDEEEAAQRQLH